MDINTFNINSLSPERKQSYINAKNAFAMGMRNALDLATYPPFCLEQNSEESQNYQDAVNDYCNKFTPEDFMENPVLFDLSQIEKQYSDSVKIALEYKNSLLNPDEATRDYCEKNNIQLSDGEKYRFGIR